MTATCTAAGPAAPGTGSSGHPRAARQTVLMLAGGGLSHASGGVGTQISYLLSNWSDTELAPEVRVLDTRGAGSLLSGAIRFAGAVAVVLYKLRLTAAAHRARPYDDPWQRPSEIYAVCPCTRPRRQDRRAPAWCGFRNLLPHPAQGGPELAMCPIEAFPCCGRPGCFGPAVL